MVPLPPSAPADPPMRPTILLPLVLSCALAACDREKPAAPANAAPASAPASASASAVAEAMLPVPGGRIWYRVASSDQGTGTPVILLHGGPGFSSFYLRGLEAMANERPVVRYDQLGSGKSDKTNDSTLWTIPHFVAELDSLRSALHYDRVHLVGHSWGTILALEYYRAHPEHVASMTLQSAALDIPAWERNARELTKTLSPESQRAIRVREAEKNFAAPDYQKALEEFYGKYVWLRPVQADLDSTMATANQGIYNYMQGPSEFTITGTLKTYDATPYLRQVKVPTLYTAGQHDEANPRIVKHFADLTPGARFVMIPDAGHMTPWDNPQANLEAVRTFLRFADGMAPAR